MPTAVMPATAAPPDVLKQSPLKNPTAGAALPAVADKVIQAQVVVAQVKGAVEVQQGAGRRTLRDREFVQQGETIRTQADASVVLVFSNGATVSLGASSELVLKQFLQDPFSASVNLAQLDAEPTVSKTILRLNRGEVVASVKALNLPGGSGWRIVVPGGVVSPAAGSRGGVFRVSFGPKAGAGASRLLFSLQVVKGSWGLTPLGGVKLAEKIFEAGQQVAVEIDVATKPEGATAPAAPSAAGRN